MLTAGSAPGIDGWRSVEVPYAPDRALAALARMLLEFVATGPANVAFPEAHGAGLAHQFSARSQTLSRCSCGSGSHAGVHAASIQLVSRIDLTHLGDRVRGHGYVAVLNLSKDFGSPHPNPVFASMRRARFSDKLVHNMHAVWMH